MRKPFLQLFDYSSVNASLPIFGDIFPRCSGCYSVIGVTDSRVINVSAGTFIFFHSEKPPLLFSNLFAHYLRYCVHNFIVTSAAAGRTLCDFLNIFKSLFHVLEFCFAMKCVFNVCISHFFAITNCIVFHHKPPFILSKISLKYTLKAFYVSCLDTYLLILMLLKRRTYAVFGINSFLFAHKIFAHKWFENSVIRPLC